MTSAGCPWWRRGNPSASSTLGDLSRSGEAGAALADISTAPANN